MSSFVDRLHALRRVASRCSGSSAARVRDRIDRDLVPRTRHGDDWLVCGIVGPNNAGKSALFNGLVGRALSPSVATGAATRRLVAAAHPALARLVRDEEAGGRFAVRTWERAEDALASPERPDEIMLAESEELPERLLLIDAPDFDSIALENRAAAEALVAAADVAICVVTKHTYQNAQVVRFLEDWLAGGRPWIAVYNEAPNEEVARAHLDKLASDIGAPPVARYFAPWSEAVANGVEPLRVRALDGGADLRDELARADRRSELKRAALAASLEQLRTDVRALVAEQAYDIDVTERVRERVLVLGRRVGEDVARDAMPAEPFLAAFSSVIDRRRNKLRKRWHGALRAIAAAPRAVVRGLRGTRDPEPTVRAGLIDLEEDALATRVGAYVEEVARTVGPASDARELGPELQALLDADLVRPLPQVVDAVLAEHRAAPVEFASFQDACERLVEKAIEERGHDRDVQAFMDLATLLPVAAAAATVFLTGGFAVDFAVASGGVVSTALLERYSHWFDRGIAREARRMWRRQRGGELSELLARVVLASSWSVLAERLEGERSANVEMQQWLEGNE